MLRIIGASPAFIFALIETENLVITLVATLLATILLTATLIGAEGYIVGNYGIQISHFMELPSFLWVVAIVLILTVISGLVPGWVAYQEGKY